MKIVDKRPPAPLPFVAETADSLRLRYPAAVAPLVDRIDVEAGRRVRPGAERRHVFDWPDGVRLIVSREMIDRTTGVVGVHMSASVSSHGEAYERLTRIKGVRAASAFLDLAMARWVELSGGPIEATFIGFSPGLVPHWVSVVEQRVQ